MPLKGSGKEIGELPSVECSYPDCQRRFHTAKEMKRHKKRDGVHEYCFKCDVDCIDEEDLIRHKVEVMCHWLYDTSFRGSEEWKLGPIHLLCEFCGKEFQTLSGRDLHRQRDHRASQNIQCAGCSLVFHSAGDMIAHLEQGDCEAIPLAEFELAIINKHIFNQILKNPQEFQDKLHCTKGVMDRTLPPPPSVADTISSVGDNEHRGGGVSVLNETEGYIGQPALLPVRKPQPTSVAAITRSNLESWPRLPDTSSQLSQMMAGVSLASPTASVAGTEISEVTERRAGTKQTEHSEFWPPIRGTGNKEQPSAWTTNATSNALFKDAKPTPPSGALALATIDQVDESSNLLNVHLYNPGSNQFNPDMFFNLLINRYTCPFPGCVAAVDTVEDIKAHLRERHIYRRWTCPGACGRRFGSASALVSHTEMSQKCQVRKFSTYNKALDEITGGFLTSQRVAVPEVVDVQKQIVKAGELSMGVSDTQYSGQIGWRW